MRILFDLYTPQLFVGGAGEYVRKVFHTLVKKVSDQDANVQILGLYDSSFGKFAYPDLTPNSIKELGVEAVDANGKGISQIIREYKIDKIFIGAAQYWGTRFNVEEIQCPVICVIHDLMDEEFTNSYMKHFMLLGKWYKFAHFCAGEIWRQITNKRLGNKRLLAIKKMVEKNHNCQLITVSEYSCNSLIYFYGIDRKNVKVLYSPERVMQHSDIIDNKELRELVETRKRYLLMLNANRYTKNPEKIVNAFCQYANIVDDEMYLVTVGYPNSRHKRHIVLPYLCESDLWHVVDNCYALLFPSIMEGFGYPPVEAMQHGKPVMASNVTSIPEILADAPIYFSPVYESDIFKAMCTLKKENYSIYSEKSRIRGAEVAKRQQENLSELINIIIN